MRKVIALTMLCFCLASAAMSTAIFGIIYKDGVAIFADSRSVFKNNSGVTVAFFEGTQKVHQINDYAFAMAGLQVFNKITIAGLVDAYLKTGKIAMVDNFYNSFMDFCRKFLSDGDAAAIRSNYFIVAGYKGAIPYVSIYFDGKVKTINRPGEIVTNRIPEKATFYAEIANMLSSNSVNYATRFISEVKDKYGAFGEIGGDPSVLVIKANRLEWLRKNKYNFKTPKEFYQKFKDKQIRMKYLSKTDSIALAGALQKEYGND